ncbi:MAG TPA: hypothetical protein VM639_18290 [Dongiaceae bacterium]|nr:hypothetical protein [Dongiaceae bacterium]
MQKRTARLQRNALSGEPELTSLLGDPVMQSLWRADHIDPDEAKRLFAATAERLHQRSDEHRPGNARRQSAEPAAAEDDQSYAFV